MMWLPAAGRAAQKVQEVLEEQQLEAQTLHRLLGYRPHGTTKDDDDGDDELACTPLFAFLPCLSACTGCWGTNPMARPRTMTTAKMSWPVCLCLLSCRIYQPAQAAGVLIPRHDC